MPEPPDGRHDREAAGVADAGGVDGARREDGGDGRVADGSAAGRLRLMELLAARISHDLAGLVGALAGALELATGEDAAEALDIARDASAELAARLRLLRAAWAGDVGVLRGADLGAMTAGLGPRVRVETAGLGGAAFPAGLSRLLPNLLLLGAEALPRGGVLTLSGSPGSGVPDGAGGSGAAGWVRLEVQGPRAAWPETLAGLVAEPARAWAVSTPRQLQPALVVLLARDAGLGIGMEASPAPSGVARTLAALRVSGPV